LRALTWSAVGFDAAGRGRATGASIVTGGRDDCWASAPENEATAIRPATAETFLPEWLSGLSGTGLIAATDRNDLGIFAAPILTGTLNSNSLTQSLCGERPKVLVSSEKFPVNAN
jgi:hypothetical protein